MAGEIYLSLVLIWEAILLHICNFYWYGIRITHECRECLKKFSWLGVVISKVSGNDERVVGKSGAI